MGEEDVQAVRRIYTAITTGDVDDLVADVTHDIEMTLPDPLPWGGTHLQRTRPRESELAS